MSLENPSFLNEVNENWPVGAVDQRHEGDDHIRNFKKAVKATFPGMAGRAWRVVNRSGSGGLSLTDNMTIQNAGGITLTPDAASVLGNGWMCMVRASGSTVTVDPPNNINGAGSYSVPPGYAALIFCNGSEFFAILVYQEVPPTTPSFPAGTKMVFHQTAAPSGWTKDLSAVYNDSTIRTTTGTVATGGADAFTTVFGSGKRTGGTGLTAAQNGPHAHGPGSGPYFLGTTTGPSGGGLGAVGTDYVIFGSTASSGSGSSHDHGLTMNPKYVDVIVASKNA